jgi:hypothetical protein
MLVNKQKSIVCQNDSEFIIDFGKADKRCCLDYQKVQINR